MFQPFNVLAGYEDDLTIRSLFGQNLLKSLQIGFPQHLVNHLPGLIRTIQLERDSGQRLATADGHISTSQRYQVLLQLLELRFA
ncbi:MAG: Uncharacterised protein [Synechococcus sp. MIT S9220]|nr:MAG: Uncharacterised protein [Synechococcus sp. MIT S9220]